MLTTIQELEREIDQFHKNIKDSNELMKILMSLASLTKTQTESFEVRTKALQDDLAKLVGVRRETIGNLEKGRYNPSLVLAWNIAKVFNVSIEDIFTVED